MISTPQSSPLPKKAVYRWDIFLSEVCKSSGQGFCLINTQYVSFSQLSLITLFCKVNTEILEVVLHYFYFMSLHLHSFSKENVDCSKLSNFSKNIWNRETVLDMSDGSDDLLLLFMHLYFLYSIFLYSIFKKIAHRSVAVGGLYLNFLGLKTRIMKCRVFHLYMYTIT